MRATGRRHVPNPGGPLALLSLLWLSVLCLPAFAAERSVLQDVDYAVLAGEEVQITLGLSGPAPEPGSFAIDRPARISIDLPGVALGLARKHVALDAGPVRTLRAVEAGGRTRVVLELSRTVPYEVTTRGNRVIVRLEGGPRAAARAESAGRRAVVPADSAAMESLDFRRGGDGEARVVVRLSRPDVVVDMEEKGGVIVVDFLDTAIPDRLSRRLDVTDFATPVQTIDAYPTDGRTRMIVRPEGNWEHLAYQTGSTYVVEVRRVAEVTPTGLLAEGKEYTGERLSLNFQNIEVRAVLQLIADFTGLNVVASDTVTGSITLRLKNVPWDQALEIILKTQGLAMRRIGDVIMVAPAEEVAQREKAELEAQKQLEELAPLRTQFFQVNYAKAEDLANLLRGEEDKTAIISERGSVTLDARTNTLMVQDTADKLQEIGALVEKLDIPIRQVLIESRIVVASDDFSRELGVRAGLTHVGAYGDSGVTSVSGSATGNNTVVGSALDNLAETGQPFPVTAPALNDRLNVDMPVTNPAGRLALAILGADYLVDLELSALQSEGRGEVISNPRVVTANQKEAVIEQGEEIPYQEATSAGATSISFKKAVLSLVVTPQITPDDRVLMDLEVSKDSRGELTVAGPAIDTRAVTTQVLVDNGATVVLGGIFEHTRNNNVSKVPLLGDLPLLGHLFKSTQRLDSKAELLIFVTPKILKEGITSVVQ